MLRNLVRERQERNQETTEEIYSKWGGSQTISGPYLTIPFKINERGTLRYVHFLPEDLDINGTLYPEIRKRGIYKVLAYKAELVFSGMLNADLSQQIDKIAGEPCLENAFMSIGITDMRGVNQDIRMTINNKDVHAIPGVENDDIISSGVTIKLDLRDSYPKSFRFVVDINGSETISFIPAGKETDVSLSSSWNTPSFDGAFLPDDRIINEDGFTASWHILEMNRNYPQYWIGEQHEVDNSKFGVKLMFPVDHYQKTMRSVKYAILFISLTFLVFFFIEIKNKRTVHLIHYVLVGFALCIFYSLLLALSEHLSFNLSYLISSVAVISLIASFCQLLFGKIRVTILNTGILITLYVFLFFVLQINDFSLLFGNIGLFIILAIIMIYSVKIDWFNPLNHNSND